MAKLKVLPELGIIDGFKGVIDFYVNHQSCDPELEDPGIPCARRWPRSPGKRRAAAVEAQWPAFAYAAGSWNFLSPEIQQAYRDTAADTHMSGRDLYVKSFLTSYFREGQWD